MSRKERVKSERLEVSGRILVGTPGGDRVRIQNFKREFTSRPKCVEHMNGLIQDGCMFVDEKWSIDTLKKKLTDLELSEFKYKGFTIRRYFAE